jgi:asparagine synthase (glutamine-hydrolysing)
MANSLELRSPLLDPEVFAWGFALDPGRKLKAGAGGKAILKAAMRSRLPHDLLYRPKKGFTVPLARWFRGPLSEQVRALGASSRLADHGAVRLDTVQRMAEAHLAGTADHSKALWLVWMFDAFLAHDGAARVRGSESPGRRRPMPARP